MEKKGHEDACQGAGAGLYSPQGLQETDQDVSANFGGVLAKARG